NARPPRHGFRIGLAGVACGFASMPAHAEAPDVPPINLQLLDAYVDAFAALDRHEVAALVLTLGVLVFAVTTAILLVRTRMRAIATEGRARDRIVELKAESDRYKALLMSEQQILVSWAAAGNEPDIMGDVALVTSASQPQRALAFGSWLEPDKAQAMERA